MKQPTLAIVVTLVVAGLLAFALWGWMKTQTAQNEAEEFKVGCDPAFVPVRDQMARSVHDLNLPGGALLLVWKGKPVCETYFESFDEHTTVPIVSAAKWLSAATILTLVDEGKLALDDRVSKYLPYFTGDKSTITLRQLLSHTSGFPDYSSCMFQKELTLEACAREIATLQLISLPGDLFYYGGAAFTVAGRMAEVASGKSWAELFETRIAKPLGLTDTNYGETENPLLSEGYTISSLRDYGRFLKMIFNQGISHGRRVLSANSIAEMQKDQTVGAEIGFSPRDPHIKYGLGVWLDSIGAKGSASEISCPGARGFVPWIDFDRNLIGIFMVSDSIDRVWNAVREVQQKTREIIDSQTKP
ncbi:beta-lactamase family protein [Candidatus Acetothermia bacterium]|nr:beta-lactamase family protein [Candidatus Acetothermia bacterium]MBI3660939.1 beta-lactamase family protein [Candidatus Acetothermia bacterium]